MNIISSNILEQPQITQYEALLEEAKSEAFFYGEPLNHIKQRQVVILDGKVVGCFEHGTIDYEGRSYWRTNRPYTMKAYRGRGLMLAALIQWYSTRRPAMCWIDDDNTSSIRLFQNVGFRKETALHHKDKDGHIYLLPAGLPRVSYE